MRLLLTTNKHMQKTSCWSSLSWKTQFWEETDERVSRLWCVVNTYYKQNMKSSMTTYLLFLSTNKSPVWVVFLLPSKFLQIKLVAATVHWKLSLGVTCKHTLLPPTFFSPVYLLDAPPPQSHVDLESQLWSRLSSGHASCRFVVWPWGHLGAGHHKAAPQSQVL